MLQYNMAGWRMMLATKQCCSTRFVLFCDDFTVETILSHTTLSVFFYQNTPSRILICCCIHHVHCADVFMRFPS